MNFYPPLEIVMNELRRFKHSADFLANSTQKLKKLVAYLGKKFPNRDNCKRLVKNFNPTKVMILK